MPRSRRAPVAPDLNAEVAGLLHDLALLRGRDSRGWGYRRAALTIMGLDRPVDRYVEANALRRVPNIGPSTERIVREYLETGSSDTVERAVAQSGMAVAVQAARALGISFGDCADSASPFFCRVETPEAATAEEVELDAEFTLDLADAAAEEALAQ